MKIVIDFDTRLQEAIIEFLGVPDFYKNSLIRYINDSASGTLLKNDKLYMPWRCFLFSKTRDNIVKYTRSHSIGVELSDAVKQQLAEAGSQSYSSAKKANSVSYEIIKDKLLQVGFVRELTNNQMSNLSHLGNLPAGATFSVPGAGKTTEALAYFFLNADTIDSLLVVAPRNAFGAWEEQLSICAPSENRSFVRLRGGEKNIENILKEHPRYMLITYDQYLNVKEIMENLLLQNSCFMFLDESHRIKSGRNSARANAILDISYLPKRKLIMSGTPMPQSVKDLVPQIQFLYPEVSVSEDNAIEILQPIFVRTTKKQLGIPEIQFKPIKLKMDPLQEQIYQLLKSETKRQLQPYLSDASRKSLRDIGKCVMKIMQFVSNPALLAKDMEFAFNEELGELLLSTDGPKIDYVCKRARELAADGKKVIIWSTFVANVELLATRLADLGADYIDGSIDTGDENESDTREWKIKEFHDNPNKWVLVANPAAASEGISLHKVCQTALYVDRSFNAAHFLQSVDRIHRLGLKPDQIPYVEIIECENTIDEVISHRLKEKVDRMATALNDPSLNIDVIPYDFKWFEDDNGGDNTGMEKGDVDAILQYFLGGTDD